MLLKDVKYTQVFLLEGELYTLINPYEGIVEHAATAEIKQLPIDTEIELATQTIIPEHTTNIAFVTHDGWKCPECKSARDSVAIQIMDSELRWCACGGIIKTIYDEDLNSRMTYTLEHSDVGVLHTYATLLQRRVIAGLIRVDIENPDSSMYLVDYTNLVHMPKHKTCYVCNTFTGEWRVLTKPIEEYSHGLVVRVPHFGAPILYGEKI